MKKVTKPHKPKDDIYIFTEGINYFETDEDSIWGKGDKDTLKFLKKTKITGKWLNIAAGDGRYNLDLLKKADLVVATDIDIRALSKLHYYTPTKYKSKLKTVAFNVTERFPFKDENFDGIFCTGILHLFPKSVFKRIVKEIDRVLKPNGNVIIDFATDIKRTSTDGKDIIFGNGPRYKLKEAENILKETFGNYSLQMYKSNVNDNKEGNPPYRFKCNFILLSAIKKNSINPDKIHKEFLNLLENLSDKEWVIKVNKNWTVKDVVAHLVGWEREDAETLSELWKTHKKAWFLTTTDFDEFNRKAVKKYSSYSPKALIKEWGYWYNKVEKEMKKIGISKLKAEPKLFGWLFDEGDDNHYYVHLKQIKKALGKS